jgi:multicomponent Na+:H+ antiporter subunit D
LADWLVIVPVLLCLAGGAGLVVLRSLPRLQAWVCGLVVLAVLGCDGVLVQRIMVDGPRSMTMGNWLPPFGISFTADLMGAGLAMLSAFVTFAVVLYIEGGAPERARRDGLYPLVLLLLAGTSGAFLTGDLFNLYVWLEVSLAASFGLLVLSGNPLQLEAAVKYGIANFLATTLFLAALGLLYGLLGTLNMADIVAAARRADIAPLSAVAALFVVALAIKAAAFPVNAWLPASYHAPPAAISALMGGLLTKVALYALLRLLVMLVPDTRDVLGPIIDVVAIATMIVGPLGALVEPNLRRAVGFLLVGGIGVALVAIPSSDPEVIAGGILYVAHAMLSFAALYLVAGLIDELMGETRIAAMSGLYSTNPLLALLLLGLLLAVAGVPPFLGFWPKLVMLRGFAGAGDWIDLAAILSNAFLTLVAGARLWSQVAWRTSDATRRRPRAGMGAVALLTGAILMVGLWPSILIGPATIAARELLDPSGYIAAVGLAP